MVMRKKLLISLGSICIVLILAITLALGCTSPSSNGTAQTVTTTTTVTTTASTGTDKVFNWRCPSLLPAGHNEYVAMQEAWDAVSEMSNGRLNIEMFPAGALVPTSEFLEAVGTGVVEVAMSCDAYAEGVIPCAAAGWNAGLMAPAGTRPGNRSHGAVRRIPDAPGTAGLQDSRRMAGNRAGLQPGTQTAGQHDRG